MKRPRRSIVTAAASLLALPTALVMTPHSTVHATSAMASSSEQLRSTITLLNDTPDGSPDQITLANVGPFLLPCGTGENGNVDGDLDYLSDDDLTITFPGPGRATIAVDRSGGGCTVERVIDHLGDGKLRLERVVIADGDLSDIGSGLLDGNGAGIRMLSRSAQLELADVVVENNRAGTGPAGSATNGGSGGGIYATGGSLRLVDSIVRDNRAGDGSDAPSPRQGGGGGGIAVSDGDVEIVDSIVEGNRAGDGGDGDADDFGGNGGVGGGVLVFSGTLTVTGGRIGGAEPGRGNRAGDAGEAGARGSRPGGAAGGVRGPTFPGSTTLTGVDIGYNVAGDGRAADTQFPSRGGDAGGVYSRGSLVIADAHIHHNRAGVGASKTSGSAGQGGNGGGVVIQGGAASLQISDSLIAHNQAGPGGGSADGDGGVGGSAGGVMISGATAEIDDTVFEFNRAGPGGSAGPADFGGTGGSGGGIGVFGFGAAVADTSIDDSTFRFNEAGVAGPDSQPGNGGAGRLASGTVAVDGSVFHGNGGARFGGALSVSTTASFENTTFDANSAADDGGAIYGTAGERTYRSVTFSDNGAVIGGHVVEVLPTGTSTFERTLLGATAQGARCGGGGNFVDGGDTLEAGTTSTCDVPITPTIDLGPLQDNGGPTWTRAPYADSPVVDTVAVADCVDVVDQRNVDRPVGAGCDIGAVEIAPAIEAVDDAEMAIADSLVVDVLGNDDGVDAELDPTSVVVVGSSTNGGTSVDPSTGRVTYTPIGSFEGTDSFEYEVCLLGAPSLCDRATAAVEIIRPDTIPEGFAFTDQTDVPRGSVRTSNPVTVSGVNQSTPVDVTGGRYSVNGGAFTSVGGSVVAGDSVRVRHSASDSPSTATDTTLTIGGVSDTFTSTTAAMPPPPPDPDPDPDPDPVEVPGGAARFVPLSPVRLFDTRSGEGLAAVGKIAGGDTLDVQVTGQAGVPGGASAVVINLTVDQVEGPGFVTAFPAGGAVPNASTLNTTAAGQVRPNLAVVPLSDDGMMSVFALMSTHLIGDVSGYYVETDTAVDAGRFVPLPPTRMFDTRPEETPPGPKGFVGADSTISVQVAGVAGVPDTGVSAVVMNVTATQSAGPNFVSVWPTGDERPDASALNLFAGETTANLVMVPLGDDGKIDFYTLAGAHLLGDVTGYVTDDTAPVDTAGLFVPLDPERVFDTRVGEVPPGPKGFVGPGETITTLTAGAAGIPADAAAVVLNVTATQAAAGFVTAFPSGGDVPNASTLNPQGANDTRPNAAILPIGDGGGIDYFVLSGAHLLADTTGYYLD